MEHEVTMIPILIGAVGTVTRGLVKGLNDLELEGRMETIHTTELLRSARIPRRVQETWGDLLSLKHMREKHHLTLVWKILKDYNNNNNNTTKWFMHKPEFFIEKEIHKIIKDFVIQTNHLISTSSLFLVSYLPTPPLGQDMTQGQFLSGV